MKKEIEINVNMLIWAITRAGYELHEFSKKVPRVTEWIEGVKRPTLKQLEAFSKKVHIPFGYLFLKEPPKEKMPIPFFRSNHYKTDMVGINVYDSIQLMLQRQDWLRGYLEENGFEKLSFVGSFVNSNDVNAIVKDIRKTLCLSENWASAFNTWEDALNHLVNTIEDKGIIASFNGVVFSGQ